MTRKKREAKGEVKFEDERVVQLRDCTPGDLLVVVENGLAVYIELGALNGSKKHGNEYALVSTYLPERHEITYRLTWRILPVDTVVLAVHESAWHRKQIREMRGRRVAVEEGGAEVDPMMTSRGGTF